MFKEAGKSAINQQSKLRMVHGIQVAKVDLVSDVTASKRKSQKVVNEHTLSSSGGQAQKQMKSNASRYLNCSKEVVDEAANDQSVRI